MLLPVMGGSVSADTPIKVACVGDSITAGSQATNASYAYPTQLQNLLGSAYEVKNFGVSGRTLLSKGDNPYINDTAYTNSKSFNPDYVIIMLGTNDAKPQNWAHKADFEADMKTMIETYRALESRPTVLIATSPTVGTTNIGIAEAVVTGEVVPLQKKVAAEMGCPVIDINALTKNMPQNYADGIHPNDTGYAAIAQMFRDGLTDVRTAAIKGLSVNGVAADIDDDAATIRLTLPVGTNVTSVEPEITLADGATIDKTGAQNFTNAVKYTVTSPDGKVQKTYSVSIKAQDKIKVACVGDSVTVGVGNSGGKSYPEQLQALLGSRYEVKNFGNSGKTVQDDGTDQVNTTEVCGYRHTNTYRNSLQYDADIIIFMMGGNDAKAINWKDGKNNFEADLRALLTDYINMESKPQVVVGTTLAAVKESFTISTEVIKDEIVPIVRYVAADMGLPLVDTYAATAPLDETYFISDGVHYNDDGYAVVAETYDEALADVLTTIHSFEVENGANRAPTAGVIDNDQNTVTVTLPAGTDVTALEPVLALPQGAVYSPIGAQDFTAPVTYTVTAADGTTTREYTVSVNVLDTIKIACVGDSMTAAATYPNALEEFLGDGYEIGRFGVNSTTAQKDGQKETGDGRGAYIYHPQYQQSLDFEPDIVLLTLGSNDSKQAGDNANWVTNWKEDSPENYERDLKELVASYQAIGATVILGTSPSGYDVPSNWGAKAEIVNNVIAPIQRKVAAEMGCFLTDFNALTQGKETTLISNDGLHPSFNGYYQLAGLHYVNIQNVRAAIKSFTIGEDAAVINQADKSVYLSVPDGTDLTALTPGLVLADGAVADKTGSQSFGQPVEYTITAANGWTSVYTVTVTSPSGVSVSKIELLTTPAKTTYLLGEALDLTGATLAVIYTDGTRETVAVTPDMVSGYDWLTVSKQTLTITYEGKATTMDVQVKPHGVVGSFSTMSGKFSVLDNGANLLYADWKWADQRPIDLSGYGDRSTLRLELDITFGSSQDIDPAQMWNQLVIKLRSTDKAGVEGDPEVNSGNKEHNYGWNMYATSFDEKGSVHISIPLNQANTNKKGVMDWSEVDRIIIQCYINDQYKTNSADHYMDIRNVYIVDTAQTPEAPVTTALAAAITEAKKVDTSLYTTASAAAFRNALATANAYMTNPYAAQEAVDNALAALTAAQAALEVKTYTPGNVDEDEKGQITANDALMALQAATQKITLSESRMLAADVDGNGSITAGDALAILQYATAKIDSFPVENQ